MPMPHRTFAQVARRRLTGKEGRERIREVRSLLDELPDYRNGPYADLRKWLLGEIEETRVRSSAVHRDSIAVRREGAAQIALVGPPNVGKSSLLQALSDIQIKTGDYAFTTLRPVPALTRIGGVLVQLVEIPGLIEGATEDRGGGRALLGVLRSADAIVYCARADAEPADARRGPDGGRAGRDRQARVRRRDAGRRGAAGRDRAAPDGVCAARGRAGLGPRRRARSRRSAVAAWRLTGLIRVRLRTAGTTDEEPLAVPAGATIADVATAVHQDLGATCSGGARLGSVGAVRRAARRARRTWSRTATWWRSCARERCGRSARTSMTSGRRGESRVRCTVRVDRNRASGAGPITTGVERHHALAFHPGHSPATRTRARGAAPRPRRRRVRRRTLRAHRRPGGGRLHGRRQGLRRAARPGQDQRRRHRDR